MNFKETDAKINKILEDLVKEYGSLGAVPPEAISYVIATQDPLTKAILLRIKTFLGK